MTPTGPRRPFRQAAAPAPDPPGLAARILALNAVADVAAGRRTLDERFNPVFLASLGGGADGRDRALARSIATVSFRRLGTIRAALSQLLDRGLPKKSAQLEWILVTAAAQILYLEVADHAAVDLAVRLARRDARTAPYAPLVNAVLRAMAQRKEELGHGELFADAPAWLVARWRIAFGAQATEEIAAAHRLEPTLDVTVREAPEVWAERLGGLVLPTGSVRVLSHAPVPELPGYEEGAWWVQDAAAALPARFLRAGAGERIVDLCAAPGGKTAQLAAAGASVVAVDKSAERLKRLAANLSRLGLAADARVADALTFDGDPFDGVLLDAPCSATGTIRRHPDVAWTKRPADLVALAGLQGRLLDRAAGLTRPGGRLVYCVCSLEPEEGEAQISALLRRNPDLAREPIGQEEVGGRAELVTAQGDLRSLPCHFPDPDPRRAGLDGFYAARLRRRQG